MPKIFVPTPNAVEVTIQHRVFEGNTASHVVHFLNNNPPTTVDQTNAFVGQIADWYRGNVVYLLSIEWQFDTVTIQPIDSAGLDVTVDIAHIKKGGISDKALPDNCVLRLEMITALAGRSYRGHRKIGGIARSVVEGNRVKPTWAELVRAAWETLILFAQDSGWTWCVLSKVADGVPRAEGVMTPITAVTVKDDVIDSWRPRVHHTLD